MKSITVIVAMLTILSTAAAGEPAIDDLAFLEGNWRGESGDMVYEDVWTGPEAGVMVGLFKLRTGDTFNVAEFFVITQEEAGAVLRFKHFRPDYTTWEEASAPNTLILQSAGEREALFEAKNAGAKVRSLRFRINEDDDLVSTVVVKKDPPETGIDEFSFISQRR